MLKLRRSTESYTCDGRLTMLLLFLSLTLPRCIRRRHDDLNDQSSNPPDTYLIKNIISLGNSLYVRQTRVKNAI